MSGLGLRAMGSVLLILLGMAVGAWATTSHFRPLLDNQQNLAVQCKAARDNLAGLAQEQGKALGELMLAANERKVRAELAMNEAKSSADLDYAAANRLQQERSSAGQCEAAVTIINEELGL